MLAYNYCALPFVANWSLLSVIGFCSLLYTTPVWLPTSCFPLLFEVDPLRLAKCLRRPIYEDLPYLVLPMLAMQFYFQFNVDETKNRPMGSKFLKRILYGKFRRAKGHKSDVELLPRGQTAATAGMPPADG
ncbi:hypothetical protein GPALN_012097 [Globodera pallida]|nr:hypothetical protein GPALN_012097 [Globodera pallida]